jgi:hypothetical protein
LTSSSKSDTWIKYWSKNISQKASSIIKKRRNSRPITKSKITLLKISNCQNSMREPFPHQMISKIFSKKILLTPLNIIEEPKFTPNREEVQKAISWWKRDLAISRITTRSAFQRMENITQSIWNLTLTLARLHRLQEGTVEQWMEKREGRMKYLRRELTNPIKKEVYSSNSDSRIWKSCQKSKLLVQTTYKTHLLLKKE